MCRPDLKFAKCPRTFGGYCKWDGRNFFNYQSRVGSYSILGSTNLMLKCYILYFTRKPLFCLSLNYGRN